MDKNIDVLKSELVKVCDAAKELCAEIEGEGYGEEFRKLIDKVRGVNRNSENMKIYVAGKITGFDGFKKKFEEAVNQLESQGHNVMNPAILPEGFEQHEYMRICYAMIDTCEAVYFLDNWEDSVGAKRELDYATLHGKKLIFQQ